MKNWKTTLAGILTAILYGGLGMLQTGNLNWKDYAFMAGTTALGAVSKDLNVTGGGTNPVQS